MIEAYRLIDKLEREHSLSLLEYKTLIEAENDALRLYAANKAKEQATLYMGIQFMYVDLLKWEIIVATIASIVGFASPI